ncbi:MAG: class I tRNA ligase family protein, partial [Alphaproteobacteria bacterium]|nr:class I tRNA ligase family protein [Alphaproteobacteria bacterium]
TVEAISEVTRNLELLRFNEAAGAAYRFVWDVFCDWYLELVKPALAGADGREKDEVRETAAWVRDQILKLLHPFMPFITEELWARTAETPRDALLIVSEWPEAPQAAADARATSEMRWVIALISSVRSIRSEMNVPAAARIALLLKDANVESRARVERHRDAIVSLARLDRVDFVNALPPGSAQFVLEEAIAALPLGDVIDFAKEKARLEKELKRTEGDLARFDGKLGNPDFVARAPSEVIEEQKEKRAEAEAVALRLREALGRLER